MKEIELPDWSETSKAIFSELYGDEIMEWAYSNLPESVPETIDVDCEVVNQKLLTE